jgi:hypothetical protein
VFKSFETWKLRALLPDDDPPIVPEPSAATVRVPDGVVASVGPHVLVVVIPNVADPLAARVIVPIETFTQVSAVKGQPAIPTGGFGQL